VLHFFFKWKKLLIILSYRVFVALLQSSLRWIGTTFFTLSTVQQHLLEFGDIAGGKINRNFHTTIWLATIWWLWRTRKNILFRGECVNVFALVD
jgi:hypothetical protein